MNYHTKNGNIMARDTVTKRYSRIQPWYTVQEIRTTLHNATLKTTNTNQTHSNLMHSQTLSDAQHGAVARRVTNLDEYVVATTRQTRQTARKGDGERTQH